MKAFVLQLPYSYNPADLDACFQRALLMLDECTIDADVIVLPEYADVPSAVAKTEDFAQAMAKNGPILDKKVRETAIRCNALVFANYGYKTDAGFRNTTHVIAPDGSTIGRYFKAHPAPSEIKNTDIDTNYEGDSTYVVEYDGVRYGFRTCYDFYFYEDAVTMARQNLDVIIGCSYQRTDTHEALEIMCRALCYNTNAWLLRSSISLGEGSKVCGSSMVVSPDGTVLANMKNEVGICIVDFDPKAKYFKKAGFGGELTAHWQYVDKGRKI